MDNKIALKHAFNSKKTKNNDDAYFSTGNQLLDLFFMSSYYENHLDEVVIEDKRLNQLFACFMRDPRFGMGRRDLGRVLMHKTNVPPEIIAAAGRYDDLFINPVGEASPECHRHLRNQILAGNQLAKKWAPRWSSKNARYAHKFAKTWGFNKQQYGKLIKCDTVESMMSQKKTESIMFEHVPSLALLKYWKRFANGEDTKDRFGKYLESVKKGEKKMNVKVTSPYDLYKSNVEDKDLVFSQLPKVSGSWLPIVDTSGSMTWSGGKITPIDGALSIGHYLAKTSSFAPDTIVTFSYRPHLIDIEGLNYVDAFKKIYYNSDCSNTDLAKVMELLKSYKGGAPEWLIVLSDMEFDCGSANKKDELMKQWRENGIGTKIVWWNFNSMNCTTPEMDDYGNVFMSGYNPMLLNFLKVGFDGEMFLAEMLQNYANSFIKNIKETK